MEVLKKSVFGCMTIALVLTSCQKDENISLNNISYKQEMREFVIGISEYSKSIKPVFFYHSPERNGACFRHRRRRRTTS